MAIPKPSPKRFLAVWLPNWRLQRRFRDRPELAGETVLVHRAVARGLEIAACCAAAARLKVRAGMPLAEARGLLGDVLPVALPDDPVLDRARLQVLARWCERYSPSVAIEDGAEPETLLLDVTGCGPAFGGEAALVRRLRQALLRRGFHPRLALADSPAAAWALSHFAVFPPSPSDAENPAAGSLATDLPHGGKVIPQGGTPAAVRPLPIEALQLPGCHLDLLSEMGIETVGRFADLPAAAAARFDLDSWRNLERACARLHEALRPERAPPDPAASLAWESPLGEGAPLVVARRQALADLLRSLPPARGVLKLECRLELEDAPPAVQIVTTLRPTADYRRWDELLRLRWERWTLPAPALGLRLTALEIGPLAEAQGFLFDDGAAAESAVADLLERLSSRLGRNRVLRPTLRPDAQPEYSVAFRPALGASAAAAWLPAPPRNPPSARPLRLLPEPCELEVETRADGVPIRLRHEGRRRVASAAIGPERIETGWWRGPSVRRDYYRVELSDGCRWWIFKRLADDRWFLHGWFD